MSSVVISGNTSGTITLDAPAVAGTTTLTLPATSGTFITTGSPQSGSILQVVNASTQTVVSNSTSSYVDTGLTATITPKFSTSTILVTISQSTYKASSNAGNAINIKLFRGATDLGRIIYAHTYTNTAIETYSQASTQYLDSPATTSATTYKTQFANQVTAASVSVQADSLGKSTITLMEIAA